MCIRYSREHLPDRVQRGHPLGAPGPTGMPGPLIAADKLNHSTIAPDIKMRRNLRLGNRCEIGMSLRI